jgi:lysosomal acid lipase/cholesteryl ester hydrolase
LTCDYYYFIYLFIYLNSTQPEIIANRGYPVEIHQVVTDDGYILELHRIPYGQRDGHSHNSTFQRRAVFLQHGMMGTDHFWLVGSTNSSLGKCFF